MKKKGETKSEAITTSPIAVARDFFASELRSVMEKRRVEANRESFEYLVELLLRSIEADKFFAKTPDGKPADNFLVGLYAEYVEGTPEVKRVALKRLGDVCMVVTGFFPDSLNRKIIDIDYYAGMGGAAYGQLSQWSTSGSPVFKELSARFREFSNVLGEMSERSGLQTNTELLRLYERWVYSGSERLKEKLAEQGIESPVRLEIKTRH